VPLILILYEKLIKIPGILAFQEWVQKRMNFPKPPKRWIEPTDLIKYQIDASSLILITSDDRIIRISAANSQIWNVQELSNPDEIPVSWAVEDFSEEIQNIQVVDNKDNLVVSSPNGNEYKLSVQIGKSPLQIKLFEEKQPEKQGIDIVIKFGKNDWKQLVIKKSDSNIYGLGEKGGLLNKKGKTWKFWNSDDSRFEVNSDPLYKSYPFSLFASENQSAYGVFNDNPGFQEWDISDNSQKIRISTPTGNVNLFILGGKDPKEVIQNYTFLTGRMSLPPLWSLGYQQCRWSYYPEERVMDIARQFRKRDIPCDALYLDIDYMDNFKCFTWNKQHFPNPKKMIKDLADLGFKTISMLDPGIKVEQNYQIMEEGINNNYFLKDEDGGLYVGGVWPGDCYFPDFLNKDVRVWWGNLYQELIDDGIAGFWNDMNEPSIFSIRRTMPPSVVHSLGEKTVKHHEVHNVYGMQMVRATYEGLCKLKSNMRHFVLSRSGYSGTQKYAWTWTGDNKSSWDHLQLSIPKCLGLGISGHAGIGPDIGGFRGVPTPELYARWIQIGVFYPLSRTHTMHGTPDQEPWSFGKAVEDISRKYIKLRYQLMPYLYTYFRQTTIDGVPLMRALFMEFPNDSNCYDPKWENTEFFCGPSLLIAPILENGVRERDVYLPEGRWYDFDTLEEFVGGQIIKISAPLDHLPIFVRDGSIIPIRKKAEFNTTENLKTPIEFKMFGSAGLNGLLYLDDGLTLEFEKGEYGLYQIHQDGSMSLVEGKGYEIIG
jgi:alpha-glucosidase